MKTSQKGFTLIELMIVVLVLAILATLAYPSYNRYIRQTRLNNVRSELLQNAKTMERFYAQNHTFTGYKAANLAQNQYFDITLDQNDDANFVLRATPNSDNSDETCTVYLNDSGVFWAESTSDDCPGY